MDYQYAGFVAFMFLLGVLFGLLLISSLSIPTSKQDNRVRNPDKQSEFNFYLRCIRAQLNRFDDYQEFVIDKRGKVWQCFCDGVPPIKVIDKIKYEIESV